MEILNTNYTVTLTDITVGNDGLVGASIPDGSSDTVLTFPETGTYDFEFSSDDNGSTITVVDLNRSKENVRYNAEDLANGEPVNLDVTASYFATDAAETATLAAGVEGQLKVFAMNADAGDMVITVTNAGWKTSGTGTVTFDTIGQGCTLMYLNSKWMCIGNNGATFA
jgi:hypothetical protein